MQPAPKPFAAQLRADLPPAAVRTVLGVFQGEVETLIGKLAAAAAAADAVTFAKVAHNMAGTAAAVGASPFEQGARLAIACAKTKPERMATVAKEVAKLGRAATAEAKAVLAGMSVA